MQKQGIGTWPTLERDDRIAAVLAALEERPRRMQLIEGAAGAGKTSLAVAVADRLPGGRAATVTGLAERATTPLGAFADLLKQFGASPEDPVATVVATLARSLRGALIVDDAPRLDQPSAEVVRRLVSGFGVPVLATAREGEALPGPLRLLRDEGLVRPHHLDGLTVEEAARLLEARFLVPARDEDLHRLVLQTGGNPLHLRILVESSIEAGEVLHRGDSVQFLSANSPAELRTIVASRLATLSDEALHLLGVVAITQPVTRSSLVGPRGRDATLAELLGRGMIVSESDGDGLWVAHPLLAEPLVETGAVVQESAQILRGSGDPSRRFAAVEAERRTGVAVDAPELVWAAAYASAHGDQLTATELADTAATKPAPRAVAFAAHLAAAHHHSLGGDLDDADRMFALADTLARDSAERAALASRRGEHLGFRRADPEAAIAQGERVRGDLTAAEAVALDADLWRWRLLTQREGDESTRVPELRSAVAAVVAAAMRGEPDAALAAAAPLLGPLPVPASLTGHVAIALGLQRIVELRAAGSAADAAAYLESARAGAGDEVGFFTVLLAAQRAQEGRLTDAESLADLSIEQFRRWDGGELIAFALALRATLHAQRSELTEARALLTELDGHAVSGAAVLQRAHCLAHLQFAEGDPTGAAATIVDVVTGAMASGYRFLGALTLAEALRFGEVERTAALADQICAGMAERVEPCLAVRDLAVALRDRQPARIAPIADRLHRSGLTLAAVDGLALGLGLPADDGVRRQLHTLASTLSGDIDAPLLQHRELPALTARELEVARAAAQRLRAREIAERMGISVRTVENQLYSVYRKLGVAGRDELHNAFKEHGLDGDPHGAT